MLFASSEQKEENILKAQNYRAVLYRKTDTHWTWISCCAKLSYNSYLSLKVQRQHCLEQNCCFWRAMTVHPQLHPCLLCPTGSSEKTEQPKPRWPRIEMLTKTHLETRAWICKLIKKTAVSTFSCIAGVARFTISDHCFKNKQWKFVSKKTLQSRRLKKMCWGFNYYSYSGMHDSLKVLTLTGKNHLLLQLLVITKSGLQTKGA